jgi:hypothetical protein
MSLLRCSQGVTARIIEVRQNSLKISTLPTGIAPLDKHGTRVLNF